MTLIEKFHEWLKTEPLSNKERPTLREYQCEKIADDYAIEFAEWIKNDWACNERWSKITDSKELLQIFKKEKGL